MNYFKKYSVFIGLIILFIAGSIGLVNNRWDLTQDKRYTLSDASITVLKSIEEPLVVDVYLKGNFPANFHQLQTETQFLLENFKKINPKIDFNFIDPIKTKMSQDSLMALGMQPSILPEQKDGESREIILFPYAVLKFKENLTSIPLVVQQANIDPDEQIFKSIQALEFNFIKNIKDIVKKEPANVGILINQEELRPDEFRGMTQILLNNYNTGPIIPKNNVELTMEDFPLLKKMDAIIIAKPRKPFTDTEKVIMDQYIMQGGKTLWMIDAVNAEMDTLSRSQKILAYPMETNLNDFFFSYGVRINNNLVKDYQKSAIIKLVAGEVAGNAQFSSFLWPYFPLGIADEDHPITKNINPVKFEFPSSIEILERPNVKTNVLYQSSGKTAVKQIPAYVELAEVVSQDSISIFDKISTPKVFAVALEGKFQSAYLNRIENQMPNFKNQSVNNKMIIIADGDVGRNQIIKGKPLPLGVDLLTKQQYGNAEFLTNAIDYLLDEDNLMSIRNRNVEARLLDRGRINVEKTYWQWFNLLLPIFIISLLGVLFFFLRSKKFG